MNENEFCINMHSFSLDSIKLKICFMNSTEENIHYKFNSFIQGIITPSLRTHPLYRKLNGPVFLDVSYKK